MQLNGDPEAIPTEGEMQRVLRGATVVAGGGQRTSVASCQEG